MLSARRRPQPIVARPTPSAAPILRAPSVVIPLPCSPTAPFGAVFWACAGVMKANIITKPPTAELRENQKDEDSLPPYPVLDGILRSLVEKEMRVADIVANGYEPETVRKIEGLLYLAEYKRRQSAPGVKVTSKNFGRDRRYPIVNRFRDAGFRAGCAAPRVPSAWRCAGA